TGQDHGVPLDQPPAGLLREPAPARGSEVQRAAVLPFPALPVLVAGVAGHPEGEHGVVADPPGGGGADDVAADGGLVHGWAPSATRTDWASASGQTVPHLVVVTPPHGGPRRPTCGGARGCGHTGRRRRGRRRR